MKAWKDVFRKIGLLLIVVFIIQIVLPTVSYAFPGFFMYTPEDGKLRGYVYVKDPTKVSVDITNQGSVTAITYDQDKDRLSFEDTIYWGYDDANHKLKNVNFREFDFTFHTAPNEIVASDGETTQAFTQETDAEGNVRYFGEHSRLGLYRIAAEQSVSTVAANTYIPRENQLVSFTPAASDSNAIQLYLPTASNLPAIDFSHLALTDFVLKDVTAGADIPLTSLNRLSGYESLQQQPDSYFHSVITLESSETLIKDHNYELRLSSSSNSDEIKLPVSGTYSFELVLGIVKEEFLDPERIYYGFEGHSTSYFKNVQIKNPPQQVYVGQGGGSVESFKWDIVNQNGTIRITSSMEPDQMKKLAASQATIGKNEIAVDIKTHAEGFDFQINAGLIDEIHNKLGDAVFVFNTTVGTARIPFDVLQEAVKANGGKEGMSLKISVDTLPTADQANVEQAIAAKGGESVGKALSYELSLVENNKTVATIDSFSEYVGHLILLPADFKLKSGEKLNGAVWDPASKTLISVPLTINLDKDGKPTSATLWRKGNSIYTVYTSQKQFADVENDCFAKADIESLAASQVIQGFEDGTFRADASITRAEFATLLVRGLGVKAISGANEGFSDVKAKDWFSQAVNTAVSAGLISGYEDGTFRPTQSITHQEAITMISNALTFINAATKLDAAEHIRYYQRMSGLSWKVDNWASNAAALMLKHNILNENSGFAFEKDAKTTRGQTALLINKLLQNAVWPAN
jgi:hypothetical protein